MSNTIFITFIFGVILAAMLFSGVVKMVKVNFNNKPAATTEPKENFMKNQSEKAADLAEKNRQLMDRVKAQMEKNRH